MMEHTPADSLHVLDRATNPLTPAQQQAQNTAIVQAYLRLTTNGDFRLIMLDMITTIVLRPSTTPEEEGERRLVLRMLELVRQAQKTIPE